MGDVVTFPGMERLRSPGVTAEQLRGRVGRFALTDAVICAFPDQVMEIMGSCIVLGAQRCGDHGVTTYVAMALGFDQVDIGTYPAYEWQRIDGKWKPLRLSLQDPHGHGA